jgi:hypothetical protein
MTRSKVVALVGGLSALGGAVAGAVAAMIAAVVLPHAPVSAAQIALIVAQNGLFAGVAGSVLGTVVAFGALRRVPLGKLLLCTNAGLAAGFTASWLGGPWAYHNFGLLGLIGFSGGAILARVLSRGSASSSSRLASHSVLASESQGLNRIPAAPVDLRTPTDRTAERVRRNAPEQ